MTRRDVRSWWDYEEPSYSRPVSIEVLVEEDRPQAVFTGIYDTDGNRIMRAVPRRPIGFIHHESRD